MSGAWPVRVSLTRRCETRRVWHLFVVVAGPIEGRESIRTCAKDPALLTIDESRALADWVVATGKNVTDIYVTHAR